MIRLTFLALSGLVVLGGILAFSRTKPLATLPEEALARNERLAIASSSAREVVKIRYAEFIEKHETSENKKVQDEVGAARIRLGHVLAESKQFGEARRVFNEAEEKYAGTGIMSSDFGGIPDQAAYQAAATLNAEGKITDSRSAFVAFMREYPLSPLVSGAYKRIVKMDGKATSGVQGLLDSALKKQEAKARFELSICGPKAAVYVLAKAGKVDADYEELARLCGTTDSGTTLEGLREGLRKKGLETYPYLVAGKDLPKIPAGSIFLMGEHYFVFERFDGESLHAFDPLKGEIVSLKIPGQDLATYQFPTLSIGLLKL